MANYSGIMAMHQTLGASTVDNVSLSHPGISSITIVNRTGTSEIYVNVASGTVAPTAPTVGGANCWVIPAAICSLTIPSSGPVVVGLISAGAMTYSVEGI